MWGLLAFIVGLLYGYFSPGRQDKGRLLMNGLWIGLILGIVFGLLGLALDSNPLGFGVGFVGILIAVLVLTVLFVIGAWLGDLLEGVFSRRQKRVV